MKTYCIFTVLAVVAVGCFATDVCTDQTLCTCNTPNGKIDLTPLSSRVFDTSDTDGKFVFFYSPCSDNNTAPCLDAMLCKRSVMGDHFTIGKSSGESFINKDSDIAIEYPGDDNKTSIVILACDQGQEGDLEIVSDDDESFVFKLSSKYACVGGPASPTPSTTPKKTTPKGSTSTPKGTKTTPKGTSTTPKGTKTTPKGTSTTPKGTKTTPKGTKTTPKGTKTTPKGTKTTPKGTKTTPKGTKTTPKGTKTTPAKKTTTPKNTTPKMHTTTSQGQVTSYCSITLGCLSILALLYRQMF